MPGNPLQLGDIIGSKRPVILPPSARERHLYVCGGTGVGKSKFLEHCIRQDILNWTDSHAGLILLDPHGLVYSNIMAWLAKHGLKRPVIPIDLRRDDWIISYNVLRRRETDNSVIVSNFVDALAHVWGEAGTDRTPLFARLAAVCLHTLYENQCTVSDIMYLLTRPDIRRAMAAKVTDPTARQAWAFADRNPKEFETQLTSSLNRFYRLVGSRVMKATLGQPDKSLDLLAALDKGHIILCNLSTEGGQITREEADTYATLLLADLWAVASTRPKREREKTKPFYVYVDECQKFITPTIAENLDEARGFGLHLTLANQFPRKLKQAGPQGEAMYDSIIANAGNKVVFRLEHPDDAKMLAEWLFMNTFDTDEIKLRLLSTKVMDYREEMRESHTDGTTHTTGKTSGRGGGSFHGVSSGDGRSGSQSFDPDDMTEPLSSVEGWNNYVADSSGSSENWQEGESETHGRTKSVTRASVLIPQMGQEVSSIQYRSIDEQIFRATQKLFDQQDRHFAVRFHGGPKAPLFVKTPTVAPATTRKERIEAYRHSLLRNLPFAMPMAEASKRIDGREQKLIADLVNVSNDEPKTARGRIRKRS
jgi:hypothetical protein